MSKSTSAKSRTAAWACVAVTCVVLGSLAAFSLATQRSIARSATASDHATRLAGAFVRTRFWVTQEESLERKYRLEPSVSVRALHDQAEAAVTAGLARVAVLDQSAGTRRLLATVGAANVRYVAASRRLFDAVDQGKPALALQIDNRVVDPVFSTIQLAVYGASERWSRVALAQSAHLRRQGATATRAMVASYTLGLLVLGAVFAIFVRLRRRLDAANRREIAALELVAMSDPLTGVGNHRAFDEAITEAAARIGPLDSKLSLVLVDLDGLKVVNDTLGHQAGDNYITTVANALRASMPSGRRIFRVGGDEFAILLVGVDASHALVAVQVMRDELCDSDPALRVSVSAGIAVSTERRHKDTLIGEASLALLAAKASPQSVVAYSTEIDYLRASNGSAGRLHTGTLANALALAVDAKDSYTRSHCQTVSRLCALVAAELGLSEERIAQMRLAGLLHDVGKIGVPDAILNKPGRLDDGEYLVMQRHATLGGEIVAAADLPEQAYWITHHHERYDGTGYPLQLSGLAIPIESRIILACDAYEAMTSNRPYRTAPGHAFAISELERNAGTQFDPDVVAALNEVVERRDGTRERPRVLADAV